MGEGSGSSFDEGGTLRSPYDTDPVPEEDLWFLPGPGADAAPTDPPWPVAARQDSLEPAAWRAAEAEQYRALLSAVQAVARFAERLHASPEGLAGRLALLSVSAALRAEGIWFGPEQIALYRALRLGAGDMARDLARATWAVRRLEAGAPPQDGVREFLGRSEVHDAQTAPGDDRPVGGELDALGRAWAAGLAMLSDCHPLTRAAFGFACWRAEGITPWEELLEATVAAQVVGAEGMAPFLPLSEGARFQRHDPAAGAGARLAAFYGAVEAGALRAALELGRMSLWRDRARDATAGLSGRTPPLLIGALLRYPAMSAELAAQETGVSRASARRNLNLFSDHGLIREITGQDRYRFWTAAA
ncbi:MAG: hypothetical protein ACK5MY_14385 [Jhaorihella sp.]